VYGDTGRGIQSITERYAASNSGSTAPAATSTSWKDSISAITLTNTNKYLWCEETITYTVAPTTETIYRLISQRGTDGDTPDMSPTESTITVYGVGTSMSSPPTVPSANATSLGSWTPEPATASSTNKFVFTLTITKNVVYNGDTPTTTYTNPGTPELIAAWCSDSVDAAEYA
jgi:hypothetical protein